MPLSIDYSRRGEEELELAKVYLERFQYPIPYMYLTSSLEK